ncbi:MAG: PTS sugar transporter subunit IIA [Erysipelotrichaceae bacterium]
MLPSAKFNKHVVLPHSIEPNHEECFIYTVICKKPVHWHGDAEARLIMYIGINKKDKYKINDIFRVISNIVSNNDLTERLLDSTDYESFVSIIRNHI